MATKTNNTKVRKKAVKSAAVRGTRPVITLTVKQAEGILAFANAHGKKLAFLQTKLNNL